GTSAKSSYASPNHFTAEDFGIRFINLHWQGALITVSSNTLGVSKTIPINVTLPWNNTNLPGEDLGYIYDPNSQGHVDDWKLDVVNTGHITLSSVPISQLKVLAGKVRAAYEAEKTMPNAPSSQRPSGSLSNTSQNQTGYYDEAAVSESKYVASLSQGEQEAWYERKYQEALAKGTP